MLALGSIGLSDLRLEDVTAQGFSAAGVSLLSSTVTWTGGLVEGNGTVGVGAREADIHIADVDVRDTLEVGHAVDAQ